MLRVENIHKDYDGKPLLKGLSFNVHEGELVCLLGSSGSGKSTMLRIIAGLESPEQGKTYWDEQEISAKPTHERGFGFMFQDYALFPHRSVAQNIAFGLKMAGKSKSEIEEIVAQSLKNIKMEDFANRPVTELSGGEQQRVALARALAPDPCLLMLDEPLGALDHNLRTDLLKELRKNLRENHKPVIYVTHDQEEAFVLADRLLLLHEGKLVQEGSPEDVFRNPANPWVASFLGLGNLIVGHKSSENLIETEAGSFEVADCSKCEVGESCTILLRPEDAIIESKASANSIKATIVDSLFLGEHFRLEVLSGETRLLVYSPQPYIIGESIRISWKSTDVQCLP